MPHTTDASAETRRKRLKFRSHHTGMKENDALIGGFADRHLDELSDDEVAWLEALLMENNDIDLYNWMLGKEPLPAHLNHPVMHKLIDFKNAL